MCAGAGEPHLHIHRRRPKLLAIVHFSISFATLVWVQFTLAVQLRAWKSREMYFGPFAIEPERELGWQEVAMNGGGGQLPYTPR